MKLEPSPFFNFQPNMNQPLLDQEQWLERHRPYLTLLAHAHLNRRYSARLDTLDIVQQTLLNAFLKRDEFRGSTEAELAAWLREILKNKLADALRDRQRDKRDVRRECSFDEGIDASFSRTEGWLLVCFSCDDGKQLWSKDFDKEYGVARQTWGFCDYPLVDGDVLICVPGGSEATVVALNRHTGNEVWRRVLVPAKTSTRPLRSAHTATMRGSMPGFDYYVVGTDQAIYFINRGILVDGKLVLRGNSGRSLVRLDPLTGDTLISAPMQGQHAFTCADGRLYTFFTDGKVTLTDVNSKELKSLKLKSQIWQVLKRQTCSKPT